MAGRLGVESWSPEYGSPLAEDGPFDGDGTAEVDPDVEVPADRWQPMDPAPGTRGIVALIDGVRRIDARLVWTADDGTLQPGLAASIAAGVVRCEARAEIVEVAVQRLLLIDVPLDPVVTPHGTWVHHPPAGGDPSDPAGLSVALQQAMAELEVEMAHRAGEDADLVVVDGPLRRREGIAAAVGHIKTHHQPYLPPELTPVIGRLAPCQRTPLFSVGAGGRSARLSWYLRLPGEVSHPWSGVVRGEIVDRGDLRRAIDLADRAARELCRLASTPAKDPRAPQNLVPIGGLESHLRHRLGHAALLQRALRVAVGARQPTGTAATAAPATSGTGTGSRGQGPT